MLVQEQGRKAAQEEIKDEAVCFFGGVFSPSFRCFSHLGAAAATRCEQSQQLAGCMSSPQAFVSTAAVAPVVAAAVQKPRERQRERRKERQREDDFLLESFLPGNDTSY